eukprot:TRINITY_DN3913_c0_g1_i1.p1 TRINITY_DN3913_c0_g1~~TRINITY_DN3913_c0_g1_i1.p1  ORF type:complete len:351 (+),score=35.74 TRINITY_DN3913_c0_g1_i1:109-1161(+)
MDFPHVDALAKLLVLLLKYVDYSRSSVPFTRLSLLKLFLRVYRNCLLRAVVREKENFNQRPYFRLFANLLQGVPDASNDASPMFHTLALFAHCLHDIRPERSPGFVFGWVELISHRMFMPKLLTCYPKEDRGGKISVKSRKLFHSLLVDLFRFLNPYLRTAKMTDAIRLLYKGTLRVLLVLPHDFPEFLVRVPLLVLRRHPPSCVQMRNLILSAFPRNMRLPDPFLPNLKVDLLPEIRQSPEILSDKTRAIDKMPQMREYLDKFLSGNTSGDMLKSSHTFYQRISEMLLLPDYSPPADGTYKCRYNVHLINSLILYIGHMSIDIIRSKRSGALNDATMEIFCKSGYNARR